MLTRAANIPPPPGQEHLQMPQPDPENVDAAGDDRAQMIGKGLAAMAMTYTGLRSFEQNAGLFGDIGKAMAEPIQGVKAFVQEGLRRYRQGDDSVGAKVRSVLASDARNEEDYLKLSEQVSEYAKQDLETQKDLRAVSQYMSEARAQGGIVGMAQQIVDIDAIDEGRMVGTGDDIAPIARGGDFDNEALNRAYQQAGMTVPKQQLLDQDISALAEEYGSGGPTDAEIHGRAYSNLMSFQRTIGKRPLGGALDVRKPNVGQTSKALRRRSDLAEAYRRYKAQNPTASLPGVDEVSYESLALRERVDPVFRNVADTVRMDAAGQRTETDYNRLFSLSEAKQQMPQPEIDVANPMAGTPYEDADISALAVRMAPTSKNPEGLDPTEDLLQHDRDLNERVRQRVGRDDMRAQLGRTGDIENRDVILSTDDTGLPNKPILDEMRKGSTVDKLAAQTFERFDWAIGKVNSRADKLYDGEMKFDFTMQKVAVDEQHHVLRGHLYQNGEAVQSIDIPLPSKMGSFKKNSEQRPFTHPIERLMEGDFFRNTPTRRTIRDRGLAAGPHELAVSNINQYLEKFTNDLLEGRPEGAVSFLQQRVVDAAFEDKSKVKNVQQGMMGALTQRHAAENIYETIADNETRREQIQKGRESLSNLRRMYNSTDRYFVADSEFISPESIGGAGSTGAAKTPFEVAGAVVDPEQDASQADILYRMDLSRLQEGGVNESASRASRVEEEVRNVYKQISGKDEEDIDKILDQMKSGGQLQIKAEGQKYDLLSPDGTEEAKGYKEAQKSLDWLPEKKPEDTTASYYMRVQNQMLKKYGAGYAVGQNYADAEGTVFSNLSEQTGVGFNIEEQNRIDTMDMAHLFDMNPGNSSKSLQSINAAAFGLDHKQYEETVDVFKKWFDDHGVKEIRQMAKGERRDTLKEMAKDKNVMPSSKDATTHFQQMQVKGEREGKGRLLGRLGDIAHEVPSDDLDQHTAQFDAFLTGRLGLPEMQRWASSPEGAEAERVMKKALNSEGQFAGDRTFIEQEGQARYGGIGEDGERQEGPVPFFVNQASATMGRGALARPRLLPFYRLQNPVRQLYQRAKPNRLLNAPGRAGDDVGRAVETNQGSYLPTKQKAVRKSQKQAHQERMKNFRNSGEGSPAPNVQNKQLNTSEESPMLFAGAGSATPTQRKLYGGHKHEMQYAVTNRVAYLPNDHNRIYESRAQSTAARRDSLMTVNSFKEKIDINRQQITDRNKAGSRSMDEWIQNITTEKNITLYDPEKHPVTSSQAKTQRKHLEDAYMMSQIKKDRASNMNKTARNMLDEGINRRLEWAKGVGEEEPQEMQRSALYRNRSGEANLNVGEDTSLFRPTSANAAVRDPLIMQSKKDLVGVDAAVQRNPNEPDQLIMKFIEDPGDSFKAVTGGGKPGNQGVTAAATVGMAGEQGIMEAPFMKPKRRDFQGYPRAQIERMYNQAVEELQREAQSRGPYDMQRREEVMGRFKSALSDMSGMSETKIESDVIQDEMPIGKGKSKQFADYFQITYTDEFSKKIEENVSTTRMMNAAKKMNLTTADVFKRGSEMLQEANPDMSAKQAKQELAGKMRRQLSNEIEKFRDLADSEFQDKFFTDKTGERTVDLSGGGPANQKRKREIEGAIKSLRKQKDRVGQFAKSLRQGDNPNIDQLNSGDRSDGSLFDFFVDSETGSVSTAFRVLATSFHMQNPATKGTSLGEEFESDAGRATLGKRSSMLTTALVGHSASHTIGALGGQEKAAHKALQGWLSSKSGAAAFSDSRFQKEVQQALSEQGVDYSDIFDPQRVSTDADGNQMYELPGGKKMALEKYVESRFDWDAEEGALKVHPENAPTKTLQINPMSTLRETMRKRAGVVGMLTGTLQGTQDDVTGTPVGGEGRTLTLSFGGDTDINEGRISAQDFHELFGKKTRAKQYYQHLDKDPDRPHEAKAYDKRNVYFGNDARPITTAGDTTIAPDVNYQNTVFNEQFDFLEVDLFGGLDKDQTQHMIKTLRKSGVSEDQLARALMGEAGIAQAFHDAIDDTDLAGKAEMRRVVDYMRKSMETGSPSIYVPTKTGAEKARIENAQGGLKQANVGQWADLADRLDPNQSMDSLRHVQEAVKSIHETAQRVDTNTEAGQKAMRAAFDQKLRDTIDAGAFQEVQELFSSSLRQASLGLVKQLEEMQGRYLGGEYKISGTQVDTLFDRFNNLLPKTQMGEEGPSEEFRREVRGWMKQQRPDMPENKLSSAVDQAAGDLHSYMQEQMEMLDAQGYDPNAEANMHKWRGFGVGEGFIGRSKAQKALSSLETTHRAHTNMADNVGAMPDEQTNLTKRAKNVLRQAVDGDEMNTQNMSDAQVIKEASRRELEIARQEMDRPGSTSGLIMSTIRQPDFQVRGGYEMSRLNVLRDEAMQALGASPEEIHSFSHPLMSWSRREDYDYDLNYMAAIDDTVQAHAMRQTRANTMPEHMTNLFQMMQDVQQSAMPEGQQQDLGARELNIDQFTKETYQTNVTNPKQGPGFTRGASRVTTPMDAGEDVFEKSVSQFFGAEGLALDARADSDEARRMYALQKSIVGQFGAYAKQGAIKTRQRNSAFVNTMARLVKERNELKGKLQSVAGMPGDEAELQANQVFNSMFKRDLPDVHQQGNPSHGWDHMMETYKKVQDTRRQKGGRDVFDELHKAALTEAEITEAVAIEKYKKDDAQATARRVNNILQALHGNHQGGYDTFESAWSAFRKEGEAGTISFDPNQMFKSQEDPASVRDEKAWQRAKNAFQTQYEMNQAMKTAQAAGVGNDYMSSFANVPAGDQSAARQLANASRAAQRKMGGEAVQTWASEAASRTFRSTELGTQMRNFFSTESYRASHARQILEEPTTSAESFGQMLRDMPAGAKGVGAAVAAAGVISAVAPSPNDRTPSMGSERYDTPQPRQPSSYLGSRQHGPALMSQRERAVREASFRRVGGPPVGQTNRVPRPPTRSEQY